MPTESETTEPQETPRYERFFEGVAAWCGRFATDAALGQRVAIALIVHTATLLAITLVAHPTPLYFVETDLIGEYIPAARALAQGTIDAGHHAFKGPGYPLLLALATPACGGDAFLAARIVSALATGAAAGFGYLLVRDGAGTSLALFTLAGLMLNPVCRRCVIAAGPAPRFTIW
jgi:hypothetical protein